MTLAQESAIDALRRLGIDCHASGTGLQVRNQGFMTVAQACTLAAEVEEARYHRRKLVRPTLIRRAVAP